MKLLNQLDVLQLAQLVRDFGISLICIMFSVQGLIGFLVVIRKEIQKRLFIRSEKKSKRGARR